MGPSTQKGTIPFCLPCSFYTHRISASIACYPTALVYVIEFSAY